MASPCVKVGNKAAAKKIHPGKTGFRGEKISGMKRRLLLVHLFHIMVYVGHVVVLFELLDEFLDRLAPFGIELLGVGR